MLPFCFYCAFTFTVNKTKIKKSVVDKGPDAKVCSVYTIGFTSATNEHKLFSVQYLHLDLANISLALKRVT